MNPAALIASKRDGHSLSAAEIHFLIRGYVNGDIPDYQMAALAMAIVWRGMTNEEIVALTQEMLHSGVVLNWPPGPPVVDKHSTGGIGDKTSLILAPLLASCGLRVPMFSGRGLGPTGGTLDKLESIPGFRTDLSIAEVQSIVEDVGCVITGTTAELVPADRRMYALRDVTGTVPSVPLITASIMSKKLAESPQALVLDVKWGSGAFMKTLDDARQLAASMVYIGQMMGVETVALLTDMNQPLGRLCGNAVEVEEALDCLRGAGPDDLRECVLALGIEALLASNACDTHSQARQKLIEQLDSGAALQRFEKMVAAQGGRLNEPRPIGKAHTVTATHSGRVRSIDTEALGLAIIDLGGGRHKAGDPVDHSVGLEMLVRIGDPVENGQPVVRVFSSNSDPGIDQQIREAFQFTAPNEETIPHLPLIVEHIGRSNT